MDHLALVVYSGVFILLPLYCSAVLQLPKKILLEYKNDCLEYIKQKPVATKISLLDIKHSRLDTLNNYYYCIPVFGYILYLSKQQKKNDYQTTCFMIEITALALTFFLLDEYSSNAMEFIFHSAFFAGLLAIAVIDWRSKLIPDIISLPLLWLGLVNSTITASITAKMAIFGAITGYLFPWATAKMVCWWKKNQKGMGYGDFKMLAMLGAWFGPLGMLNCCIIASILFLSYFVVMMAFKKISRNSTVAFGPFLSIAAWINIHNEAAITILSNVLLKTP